MDASRHGRGARLGDRLFASRRSGRRFMLREPSGTLVTSSLSSAEPRVASRCAVSERPPSATAVAGRRAAARRRRARGPDRRRPGGGAVRWRSPAPAASPERAAAPRPGGPEGGGGPAARARGAEGRGAVGEEEQGVDVAAAVEGAPRTQPQPARRAERADGVAAGEAGAGARREPSEAEVGGVQRAAAHGDGQPAARERAAEGHTTRTGGAHDGPWARRHVDAAALPARERRARRDVERPDHGPAQRPAPAASRRRHGGAGRAPSRPRTRRRARRGRGGVGAAASAEGTAARRGRSRARVICCSRCATSSPSAHGRARSRSCP